ncbi:MAG: hypothetical protein JWN60_39 [Acidobacteria bacterium]|nr:hypothetical protein [Acidobacteriota bacterium]
MMFGSLLEELRTGSQTRIEKEFLINKILKTATLKHVEYHKPLII